MCKPCNHYPHIRVLVCDDCRRYVCRECAKEHNTVLSRKLLQSKPRNFINRLSCGCVPGVIICTIHATEKTEKR